MAEPELLDMLAAETVRRSKRIIDGAKGLAASGEPDPGAVEVLRVEAHGLKGAAMVVGASRLAELALSLERLLSDQSESGLIDPSIAAKVVGGTAALREGAEAAAEGLDEPPVVGEWLAKLAS
jgi:HPt (histidine-containing phosphotransfer) domain-containing protein